MTRVAKRQRVPVKAGTLLFDQQPFEIDGFRFKARSVDPIGRPSAAQFQAALRFAEACNEASDYWVGDLLAYAESRQDWKEKLDQIQSVTGLAHQTLLNRTYISKHVAPEERALAPTMKHAAAVAPMDPAMQRVWLEKAVAEGLTVSEFQDEIRASKRRQVVAGQAVLEGMYRVIYADPPWRYRDTGKSAQGNADVEKKYPTMSMEELCKLPVQQHAMKNAVLFMWVTTPMLWSEPGELGPKDVAEAWGFRYKSAQTWDKVLGIPGRFLQVQTEHLIICERGSCAPDNPVPKPKSLFTERRSDEHSEKPSATRKMIEKLYDTGPFLELFGRAPVKGWSVFGNDARLWSRQVGEG